MRSGRTRRWFYGLLTLLLCLALNGTAFAAPNAGTKAPAAPAISAIRGGTVTAVVDKDLQANLEKGGTKTFLVTLKESADVNGAAATARAKAKGLGKTPAAQRLAQAEAVIASLKTVADRGQGNLIPLLNGLKQRGAVSEYQNFWINNVIAVTGNADALKALAARPEVATIETSKTYTALGSMGLGGGGAEASPTAAADGIEWNISQINAPQAWALGIDGTGIVVANLDTGVEGTHPALARKWRGADGSNPIYSWFDAVNNNTAPYDDHGHGTHTMGTIVGSDESGANQIGVAPGARWISAKILSASGSGTDVDILEAGQWLLAPGGDPSKAPDVVSNSWGGGAELDEWFRPTIQAWRAAGIVPVFANGNTRTGQTECFVSEPAMYPESIGVGATNNTNTIASFSCHGPSPYGEVKPEISAPGVGIRSAVPGGAYQGGWSGTSMATPHVAGVAAMLRQANASLTVDEIEQILTGTATPLTDSQHTGVPNNWYGWGLVNAFDAVSAVLTGRGTVSGRVVTSGDDLESPVITHTAVTEGYAGFSLPLTAQVSDNVSVTEVNLYAKWAGDPYYTMIPMTRSSGDFKSGTYTAAIPGYLVQLPETLYYIRAVDYGNNPVSTAVAHVTVTRGLQPGWGTDLETEPAAWQHGGTNDPWQWGVPTSGPGAAHSGTNVYATNLSGNYANSTNAYLAMPPIDLTTASAGILQWWEWYDLENNYDYADVWVIDTLGNQTRVLHRTSTSGGWQMRILDLTPWAGQSIIVLFNLTSDASVAKAGWYLDDLSLVGPDAVAPAAPVNLTGSSGGLGGVTLTWDANSEPDLTGYKVYRSATSGADYVLLGTTAATTYADGTAPSGGASFYVVTATDMWGNESAYSNEVSVIPVGPVVIFMDDMEGGENGWTHGGTQDQWQLGTPTSGTPFSGANVWATNLTGNYNNSANAWLMSPAITLGTGGDNVALQFAHRYELESNYDFGYVEISTDGGTTWTQLGTRFTGTNLTWSQPTYDLTAYAGQTMNLRFRMTSDGSVAKLGWYIDDVRIVGIVTTTSDGAWVPTKAPAEKVPFQPLYVPPKQDGTKYTLVMPGTDKIGILSLPMDATVTVLETGRSVRTNPANGAYTLQHAAGTYTLQADAYGFYPNRATVDILVDGLSSKNFLLQPIPTGSVTGVVTDSRTGDPIAGATVMQTEDSRVAPVTTGADGFYTLTVLEGTYTLKVTAEHYKSFLTTVQVPGNGSVPVNVALEAFIGMPGEMAYDDGTAENAWAMYDAGNGWGVRMSPDPTKGAALLKGASFRFWDTTWPAPGGTSMLVAVFDSDGQNGTPGTKLAGPISATANRGGWTTVDLSSLGLYFTKDFYVAYLQGAAYPNVPGLASDENGTFYDRSWTYASGQWEKSAAEDGNFMIRAQVEYEVMPPVITSPADGSMVNLAEINATGTAMDGAMVTLYNNGVMAGTAPSAGGTFTIPVTLQPGANALTAVATVATGTTNPSEPVTVILDQTAPVLEVTAPADGAVTNGEVITVTGTATDEYLSGVTVNGQAATVGDGGSFTTRLIADMGTNTLTVVASDQAGNSTTVVRTVTVDRTAPVLTEVMPAADVTLRAGETLTISFQSEPGLAMAGFQIVLSGSGPLSPTPNMTETSPGVYAGSYAAPADTAFSGATIQVWGIDAAGNTAQVAVPGKLTVTPGSVPTNEAPVARITLPKGNIRAGADLTFDGSKSTDADGTIVSYEWTFGDGGTATDVKPVYTYTAKGNYTVTLTVTDDKGATHSATATLNVK